MLKLSICFHPTATGLSDWWSSSPYFAYGNYLGGVGGEYVGCTPISLSTLDSAVNVGWGIVPFWYGLQMPQSCNPNYFPETISLNTTDAYNEGRSSASSAAFSAESAGYAGGDLIYIDLESYGNSSDTCREAAEAFINGWDNYMFYNIPYLGGLDYGRNWLSADPG
jgi:hypothetical protein